MMKMEKYDLFSQTARTNSSFTSKQTEATTPGMDSDTWSESSVEVNE